MINSELKPAFEKFKGGLEKIEEFSSQYKQAKEDGGDSEILFLYDVYCASQLDEDNWDEKAYHAEKMTGLKRFGDIIISFGEEKLSCMYESFCEQISLETDEDVLQFTSHFLKMKTTCEVVKNVQDGVPSQAELNDCENNLSEYIRSNEDIYGGEPLPEYVKADENRTIKRWKVLMPFILLISSIAVVAALVYVCNLIKLWDVAWIFLLMGVFAIPLSIWFGKEIIGEAVGEKAAKKRQKRINIPVEERRRKVRERNEEKFREYMSDFFSDCVRYDCLNFFSRNLRQIINSFNAVIDACVEIISSKTVSARLPLTYRYDQAAIDAMYGYMQDKRAGTMTAAVNLYIKEQREKAHNQRVYDNQQKILEQQELAAYYAKQSADIQRAAADEQRREAERLRSRVLESLSDIQADISRSNAEEKERLEALRQQADRLKQSEDNLKEELWKRNNELSEIKKLLEDENY